MAKSEEELKHLLTRVKEENEKACLKLNIKHKIIASVPINPWQIEGGKVGAMTDFIFLDSIPESLWTMTAAMKLKVAYSWEGKQWQT